MNQGRGKFIKRGTFGYTYRRHPAWTTTNDPNNFKVDRTNKVNTSSPSSGDSSETARLKAELARLKKENSELLKQVNKTKAEENQFFTKEGLLIDPFIALQENLPNKIFEIVRTLLYGVKTPEVSLLQ